MPGSDSDRRPVVARALWGDRGAIVRNVIRGRDGGVVRFMVVSGLAMDTAVVILWCTLFWRVVWLELGRHVGMQSTWFHRHRERGRDRRGWVWACPGERDMVCGCVNEVGMAWKIKCGKCVGGVPLARLELSA